MSVKADRTVRLSRGTILHDDESDYSTLGMPVENVRTAARTQ